MIFTYKAITKEGERISGETEAKDQFELARQLKASGKILVFAEEKKGKELSFGSINLVFTRVSIQEKIIFARNLSVMAKAGLSLFRAIGILERQTQNKKFKKIIHELGEEIKKGSSLHEGMKKHPKVFSQLFIAMVKAGEESGGLTDSLKTVSDQLEKSYTIRKKIRGALIYPAVIITAMVIVGILMLIFVVPTLTATFTELGVELPATTRAVIAVSNFLSGHVFLSIGIIFLFVIGVYSFLKTKTGEIAFHFSVLRIPIIGELVKKTNSARTTRTLSSLIKSGVPIVEALGITEEVLQNSYYKEVVAGAKKSIQKGTPLFESFIKAETLYPVLVGEMMEVGEETGKLTDMLLEVAVFYEDEVDSATKNMTAIVEPFLMIIVGFVVGFFAISMISPMYSMLDSI